MECVGDGGEAAEFVGDGVWARLRRCLAVPPRTRFGSARISKPAAEENPNPLPDRAMSGWLR